MELDLVSATPAGRVLMALGTGGLIEQRTKAGIILEFNIELSGALLESGALCRSDPRQRISRGN
jgi:hypothetical protein